MKMKPVLLIAVITTLFWPGAIEAAQIRVRLMEGNFRGFLVLRSLDGAAIAHGEVSQQPAGKTILCHTILRFKDGSLFDESVVFSQRGYFRLESYRLVQHGPSFSTTEVSFDRKSGRYQARCQTGKDGPHKAAGGKIELPADLYNGMALILLKNLPDGTGAAVHLAVFTPEPRIIGMQWSKEGEDEVLLGGRAMKATRSLVKLNIGGLAGILAWLAGKNPPDLRYWLVNGEVPAFVKFEGAMFLNGPVWRLEMTAVEWPGQAAFPSSNSAAGKAAPAMMSDIVQMGEPN